MFGAFLAINQEKHFDKQVDLSKPWKLSDVVLSVEDKKFHVHRSILAIWSPVFEKMFTLNFKEKHQDEIPLPGKKATEIQEMLSIMYLKERRVPQETVFFLLDLAEEYQIEKLRSLCEECLIEQIGHINTEKDKAIEFLQLAQKYKLEQLADICIVRGAELRLSQLRNNERYGLLDPPYRQRLVEKRVENLEKKLDNLEKKLDMCRCAQIQFGYIVGDAS